jgi:hypothetical protein
VKKLLLPALGLLLLLLGGGLYLARSSTTASAELPVLQLFEDDVFFGERNGEGYLIVDIYPHSAALVSLSSEDLRSVLTATATRCAGYLYETKRFDPKQSARVSFVSIKDRNEYAEKNFGSMAKHGWIELQPGEEGLKVVGSELNLELGYTPPAEAPTGVPFIKRSDSESVFELFASLPASSAAAPSARGAEEVVFDEVDLYSRPAFAGANYPSFVPERVRRSNAAYYFRRGEEAASGRRYGELELNAKRGLLLYLPQKLSLEGLQGLRLSVRKSDPKARCSVVVLLGREKALRFEEGSSPAFPALNDTKWHTLTIPVDAAAAKALDYKDLSPTGPLANLRHFPADPTRIYGIGITVEGGERSSVFFDRLCALRPQEQAGRILSGRVSPPQANVRVTLRTRGAQGEALAATTDEAGRFRHALPAGAKVVEVMAHKKEAVFYPRRGRFLEVGDALPTLEIELEDKAPTSYPGRFNNYRYEWTPRRGAIMPPRSYFMTYQGDETSQEFLVEFSTNAFGYADKDRRYANPDRAKRVLLTGSCYLEGQQAGSQERVLHLMESLADFGWPDDPVEFISLSNSWCYLQAAWPAFLNHGLKFKPDMIVLNVLRPGLFRNLFVEYDSWDWKYHPAHPKKTHFRLTEEGGVEEIPYDPNWRVFADSLPPFEEDSHYTGGWRGCDWAYDFYRVGQAKAPAPVLETQKLLVGILRRFVERARSQGCRVVLTTTQFDNKAPWESEGVKFDPSAYVTFLSEIASEAGAEFCDIGAAMKAKGVPSPSDRSVMWPHGHWTPSGHRHAARALLEAIRALLAKAD